jgi:hypothetical protein
MPSLSQRQKRFFSLVKGVQQGKISPKKVGSKVTKAANSMSAKSVNDFMVIKKKRTKEEIEEVLSVLRELKKTITEDADATAVDKNPIAKTFTQKGDFEQYVNRFQGLEIKPKEFEAVTNYQKTKPTTFDKFSIRYENTDDFNNSTTTVIKKLREGNKLVFTAFQINKASEETDGNKKPEEAQNQPDIVIKKSISFNDEIEGGNILGDMLQKLEV